MTPDMARRPTLTPETVEKIRGAMWVAQQRAAADGHKKVADHQFDRAWSEQYRLLRTILDEMGEG